MSDDLKRLWREQADETAAPGIHQIKAYSERQFWLSELRRMAMPVVFVVLSAASIFVLARSDDRGTQIFGLLLAIGAAWQALFLARRRAPPDGSADDTVQDSVGFYRQQLIRSYRWDWRREAFALLAFVAYGLAGGAVHYRNSSLLLLFAVLLIVAVSTMAHLWFRGRRLRDDSRREIDDLDDRSR